jgi:hypothetical protein
MLRILYSLAENAADNSAQPMEARFHAPRQRTAKVPERNPHIQDRIRRHTNPRAADSKRALAHKRTVRTLALSPMVRISISTLTGVDFLHKDASDAATITAIGMTVHEAGFSAFHPCRP